MDGASVNRSFVKLHQHSTEMLYKVPNPYAEDKRPLYFISDPPHLIKTARNCWRNRILWVSQSHNALLYFTFYTLLIQCNDNYISWDHLKELYRADVQPGMGVRMVPKLKLEHIQLSAFSKMRVDLAAQVDNCSSVYKPLMSRCFPCRCVVNLFQRHC